MAISARHLNRMTIEVRARGTETPPAATSNDMKRALDWIPLDRPIDCRIDNRPVTITELGFSGCHAEHRQALKPGLEGALRFEWNRAAFHLQVVVLQCELLGFIDDGARYQSSLQFQNLTAADRSDLGRILMDIAS